MATIQELEVIAKDSKNALVAVNKVFAELRAEGSAADIVKAATAVTKQERLATKAQSDVDQFALVSVYESIRAAVLPIVGKFDMGTMANHDIAAVTITVPVSSEAVDAEKVVVNTLGKRTVTRASANGGSRTRYVYGPDGLNSRQVVEAHGEDEVGTERRDATLAEPSKYGLTHLADRIANKLEWGKVPANAS